MLYDEYDFCMDTSYDFSTYNNPCITGYNNPGEVLSMYNFIRKYTQENSKNTSSQCDLTYY